MTDRKNSFVNEKIVAEKAYTILLQRIRDIKNVNDWVGLMNCSRSWFGRCIKTVYGVPPKSIIRDVRYHVVIKTIKNQDNATSKHTAYLAGLRDEKALYKFLNDFYNTNFTELKQKLSREGYSRNVRYLGLKKQHRSTGVTDPAGNPDLHPLHITYPLSLTAE